MSILEPSTIERYEDMPSATSTPAGAVGMGLRQIPVGTRCVFTVSVPGSPPLASWSIAKGSTGAAQTLMTWAGPTPVGPFTIDGPERLIVTGTNTQPSAPIQAVALGKRGPAFLVEPEVPLGPPQFTVPTGGPPTVLDSFSYTGPGEVLHATPVLPVGLRSVTIYANGTSTPIQLKVHGTDSAEYFFGELPGMTNFINPDVTFLLAPATFAINPDEVGPLQIDLQGGTGPVTVVVLGSFTDRAVWLQPPGGMPVSASALAALSLQKPGLDRSLWISRADVARFTATIDATAGVPVIVPAPGAGLRLKLFKGFMGSILAAANCDYTIAGGGGLGHANLPLQSPPAVFPWDGLELAPNTGLTVTWIAGSMRCTVLYDIVPA